MQLKRPPFVSLCWFLRMMKRSLEVNFRGASMAQGVKENKNEPDSAAWYWKLMYGCFMSSPHEFTTMSAWLYYHLEGKLSQQTNISREITTEDHLHSGCDGRERNKKILILTKYERFSKSICFKVYYVSILRPYQCRYCNYSFNKMIKFQICL